MVNQICLDNAYMACAYDLANHLSRSQKRKVGTVIVSRTNHIIGDGVNGMPPGDSNQLETPDGQTKLEVFCAEHNAFGKLATSPYSSEGATLYTTYSPCRQCTKQIIACKIARVVYAEEDTGNEHGSLDLLRRSGIRVERFINRVVNDDQMTRQDEGRMIDFDEDRYR